MKDKVMLKSVFIIALSIHLIVVALPKQVVRAVSTENSGNSLPSENGMPRLCTENDFLALYINDKTGDFYIVDKKTAIYPTLFQKMLIPIRKPVRTQKISLNLLSMLTISINRDQIIQ